MACVKWPGRLAFLIKHLETTVTVTADGAAAEMMVSMDRDRPLRLVSKAGRVSLRAGSWCLFSSLRPRCSVWRPSLVSARSSLVISSRKVA
jgi:hypothetical protein